jgi:hypothetical protein
MVAVNQEHSKYYSSLIACLLFTRLFCPLCTSSSTIFFAGVPFVPHQFADGHFHVEGEQVLVDVFLLLKDSIQPIDYRT